MWKLVRNYLFWTYERGSIHYDVMVTLILLFIFLSPRVINYHDRPVLQLPSQITVVNNGAGELIYEVRASDVQAVERGPGSEDDRVRRGLRRLIEPIAGDVIIERYEATVDDHGNPSGFRVWAHR